MSWHECEECGQACYCDQDDTLLPRLSTRCRPPEAPVTLALAESENVGGLHAAIADRLAAEDDARRERLNAMVKGGGVCRFCGTKVSDRHLSRSPGVCSKPGCKRQGRREAMASLKVHHMPAAPAEGAEMPKGYRRGQACETCGSTGPKHRVPCAEDTGGGVPVKAEKAKAPEGRIEKLRQAGRARPTHVGLAEMPVPELLSLRDQVQEELERREEELAGQLAAIRGKRSEAA